MLTNTATRLEERLPELSRVMADLYQRDVPEAVVRAFLVVAPAYIEAAFTAIRERYGSTERYLAEHLGVDARLRERLEARLLG
jgi:protein tyrosine/serine phosphatase